MPSDAHTGVWPGQRLVVPPTGGLSRRWKSPARGPWLTSVFGLVLLVGIPIEFVTGLLSYAAYDRAWGAVPTPTMACSGSTSSTG